MREIMEEKKAVKFSLKIWSRLFPYFRQVKKHMSAVMIFMFASALTETLSAFTRFAVNFRDDGNDEGLFAFAAVFLSFIIFEVYRPHVRAAFHKDRDVPGRDA